MWKPRGSLDIGLPDGAHDATFLRELERALPAVMAHAPQCVFYLAGADPYEDDQLGGLRLTQEGLRHRDRLVIDAVRRRRRAARDRRWPAATRGASRTRSRSTSRRSRKRPEVLRLGFTPRQERVANRISGRPPVSSVLRRCAHSRSASVRTRSSDRRSRRAPPSPRASAIVTICVVMSSSSSGLCGESGGGVRRSDTRKKISSSSQKPGAG